MENSDVYKMYKEFIDDDDCEDISELVTKLIEWCKQENMSADDIVDCILHICK